MIPFLSRFVKRGRRGRLLRIGPRCPFFLFVYACRGAGTVCGGRGRAGKPETIRPLDFTVPEIVSYCSYRKGNALAERLVQGGEKERAREG